MLFLCFDFFFFFFFLRAANILPVEKYTLIYLNGIIVIHRGYSNFLLNMAFISPSEVENIYIS